MCLLSNAIWNGREPWANELGDVPSCWKSLFPHRNPVGLGLDTLSSVGEIVMSAKFTNAAKNIEFVRRIRLVKIISTSELSLVSNDFLGKISPWASFGVVWLKLPTKVCVSDHDVENPQSNFPGRVQWGSYVRQIAGFLFELPWA